jgi:hypothetical protein
MRISEKQLRKLFGIEPESKYKNRKTTLDGIEFDSQKEANHYAKLKLLQKAGEIEKIELQPEFELLPRFKKNGKTYRPIIYIADFKVTYADGTVEVIDVKGYKTEVFRLKQKMFEYKYPEYSLKIV